jgi:hypothetical protein
MPPCLARRPRRVARAAGALAALAGALAFAGASRANVADPSKSHLPARVFACPAGDSVTVVFVRELNGMPWNNRGVVTFDFCACAGFRLVPGGTAGGSIDSSGCRIVTAPLALDGLAQVAIAGGGVGAGQWVGFQADAFLGSRALASPDQNGDWIVDGADVAIVHAKIGTTDVSADLDGDGMVTATDEALALAHLGHGAAPLAVPMPVGAAARVRFTRPPAPNPASGAVTLAIAGREGEAAELAVYDLAGRRIVTLWKGALPRAGCTLRWDGRTAAGARAATGLYIARLQSPAGVAGCLFTLLR